MPSCKAFLATSPAPRSCSGRRAHPVTCSGGTRPSGRPSRRVPAPPAAQRSERVESLLPGLLRPQQPTNEVESAASDGLQLSPASLLLASAAIFGAVAADVSGASGLHLLQPLDTSVHAWVSSSSAVYGPDLQKLVAGKLVSDAAIASGLAGWAGVTALALRTRSPRLLQALAASTVGYFAGGGRIWGSDPVLVDYLKNVFQRVRPMEHHNTWAFPSGHTTAASFIVGTLLFVLLPLALLEASEQQQQQNQQQQQPEQQQQQEAAQAIGGSSSSSGGAVQSAAMWVLEHRWQLWGCGVGLTAFGRIMADVHWTSDTMAGACLGAALTACVAQVSGRNMGQQGARG